MMRSEPDSAREHIRTASELPFLVNGTLDPVAAARAREHLRVCADCQRDFELQTALMARVREQRVVDYAPHSSLAKLMVRIDDHEERRARFHWWRRLPLPNAGVRDIVVLAQSLAIVVLVLLIASVRGPSPRADYQTLTRAAPVAPPGAALLRVVFEDHISAAEMRAVLASIDGRVVGGPTPEGVFTVAIARAGSASPDTTADWLRAQPGVRFSEVVRTVSTE